MSHLEPQMPSVCINDIIPPKDTRPFCRSPKISPKQHPLAHDGEEVFLRDRITRTGEVRSPDARDADVVRGGQ